jgi:Tol biopolymer transport system component
MSLVLAALIAIAALSAIAYFWMRPTPEPTVSNYVQLTHDGLQKSLIGSDGSRLYLTLIHSGTQSVSAIQISGGEPANIPMTAANMVPVGFSPDGSDFLLVEGQGSPVSGPFWRLPALGGSPRRLAQTVGETGAWSPDGKTLAYTSAGDLFLAKADGTDPHKLLTMKTLISDLIWSPDGRQIAFDTSDFPQNGINGTVIGQHFVWEVEADGTNLHRLFAGWHNPPDECCGNWTADGKYFVFQSQGQIWALPQDQKFLGSKPQPIQLTSSPMELQTPLPGRDGKKLFVVGRTYRGELSRYDLESHAFVPFLDGISAEQIDSSRDGKWVAYISYPEGALWKSRADGTERVQLTFPPLKVVLPRWSPDGKTIVFFDFPRSATEPGRVYQISSDGGSPVELMPQDTGNQQDPTWSADGSRIAFAGDANDAAENKSVPAIRIFDVRTHQISAVPGSQGLFSPRWSPDGRTLAAMTSDSSSLMLFDFKTQGWTQIAKGSFGWPNWSKDSQYVYLADFVGMGGVMRIRISDHAQQPVVELSHFESTGQGGGSVSLAPDDSPLLLRDRGTQDVYALDWKTP